MDRCNSMDKLLAPNNRVRRIRVLVTGNDITSK
jgi:hypothetical protein